MIIMNINRGETCIKNKHHAMLKLEGKGKRHLPKGQERAKKMENLKITGIQNAANGGVWYHSADRNWKVIINGDNESLAVYRSLDMYRVVDGAVYNVRMRDKKVWQDGIIAKEVLELDRNARKVAATL